MKNQTGYYFLKTPAMLLAALVLSSGLSCAVAPDSNSQEAVSSSSDATTSKGTGIQKGYELYQRRDFTAAAESYSATLASSSSSSEDRILANIGMTLIHLSTDSQWRDLALAGGSLQDAENIQSNSISIESRMLMDSLSSLIGVEKNISELSSKATNSSAEVTKLKSQLEAEEAVQDGLKAELDALNEALEKLKALTIGN